MKWASTGRGQASGNVTATGRCWVPSPSAPPALTCVLLGQHGPVHDLPESLHPGPLLRLRLAGQQKPTLRRDDGDAMWPVVALGGRREPVQHRVAALPAADEDFPTGKGILWAEAGQPLGKGVALLIAGEAQAPETQPSLLLCVPAACGQQTACRSSSRCGDGDVHPTKAPAQLGRDPPLPGDL